MALDNAGNLLVPIASAVRGVSSVSSGASSSAATGHPLRHARPLSADRGHLHAHPAIVAWRPARGSTTVKVDPTHAGVLYVNEFSRAIWRSLEQRRDLDPDQDAAQRGAQHDRAEFASRPCRTATRACTSASATESDAGANRRRFYRTDDASGRPCSPT
jgi:hypothetical protein